MQYWPLQGIFYTGNYFIPSCSPALSPAVHIGAVLNDHREMIEWKKDRKKGRKKERKICVWKGCTHVVCSMLYEWLVELGGGGHVQTVNHVIRLNQWLHTSEWKKVWLYSRCVRAGVRRHSVDVTFLPKQLLWCCCRHSAQGTLSVVWSPPPLSSAHHSPQQPDQLKQHRNPPSVHLLWSGLNRSCPIQSSHI